MTEDTAAEETPVVGLSPVMDLPDDPDEAIAHLQEEIGRSRQEAESHLEDLKRVAADFENFRKRSMRQMEEAGERGSQRLVTALLPVLDSFDGAVAADTEGAAGDAIRDGLLRTRQQLIDVLAADGLEPIEAVGNPFDPALHEAVSGGGDGHLVVVGEVRRGYTFKGRVIRPSMVQVAAEDVSAEEPAG